MSYANQTMARYGAQRVAQQAGGEVLRAQGSAAIWQSSGTSDAHSKGVQARRSQTRAEGGGDS